MGWPASSSKRGRVARERDVRPLPSWTRDRDSTRRRCGLDAHLVSLPSRDPFERNDSQPRLEVLDVFLHQSRWFSTCSSHRSTSLPRFTGAALSGCSSSRTSVSSPTTRPARFVRKFACERDPTDVTHARHAPRPVAVEVVAMDRHLNVECDFRRRVLADLVPAQGRHVDRVLLRKSVGPRVGVGPAGRGSRVRCRSPDSLHRSGLASRPCCGLR